VAELAGEVTLLLNELRLGNKDALGRLLPLVYTELHRVAVRCGQDERTGHTLQPTALVHEAYLRLVRQDHADWRNRSQFLAVAALIMRRVLVDYARARQTAKRADGGMTIAIPGFAPATGGLQIEEIVAVDEALERLAALNGQQARIAELRYFAGLTVEETAEALGVSPRTINGQWALASAWLRRELSGRAAP
jgi:RNA polymerase sigma factor (TIGR02999 family)